LVRAVSLGGTGQASDADFPSARFAATIVASSGVGALDRQTLKKVLADRRAGAGPWIDEDTEGLSGSAAPSDLETLLQLAHLYATAPRRDDNAFETFRAGLREGLRNRDLNPGELMSDAIVKALWNDSPRRRSPTLASVDAIDLDMALGFYRERFADVSDFTFVFVGKLDVATLRPLVERYVASLPGKRRREKAKDRGLHWRPGVTPVRVEAGKEDKASVTIVYHGETPWSENAHTDLVSLQSYLEIRLREVLREQLGAAYAPQVTSTFQRIPFAQYRLSIGWSCRPADIDQLLGATRDVIAEVKKSGIDASYVEKLKSLRARDLEEGYRSNEFWLGRLATQYNLGLNPLDILLLHELTGRITSDNLRGAARKYLRDDQYLDARLLPER
jgi:zinc protease